MIRQALFILSILLVSNTFAQSGVEQRELQGDTVQPSPKFNVISAWDYVHQITESKSIWRHKDDSVHAALVRLLDHTSEPYDSVRFQLNRMNFQSINVSMEKVPVIDSMSIRWMNDSTFILDSVGWSLSLLLKEEFQIRQPVDYSAVLFADSIQERSDFEFQYFLIFCVYVFIT